MLYWCSAYLGGLCCPLFFLRFFYGKCFQFQFTEAVATSVGIPVKIWITVCRKDDFLLNCQLCKLMWMSVPDTQHSQQYYLPFFFFNDRNIYICCMALHSFSYQLLLCCRVSPNRGQYIFWEWFLHVCLTEENLSNCYHNTQKGKILFLPFVQSQYELKTEKPGG